LSEKFGMPSVGPLQVSSGWIYLYLDGRSQPNAPCGGKEGSFDSFFLFCCGKGDFIILI
jgi:hypothetical protein